MSCTPDVNENLRKATQKIEEAADKGAQVVCLQELFRSQYFCQTEDTELFKLAEMIPGESTEVIGEVARRKKCRRHRLVV